MNAKDKDLIWQTQPQNKFATMFALMMGRIAGNFKTNWMRAKNLRKALVFVSEKTCLFIQAKISLPNVQKLTKTDLIVRGIICG